MRRHGNANPVPMTLTTEDEVRLIERNNVTLPKGVVVWWVEWKAKDTKYNTTKWITRTTLPTTDPEQARIMYKLRKDNPHYRNVTLNKGRV